MLPRARLGAPLLVLATLATLAVAPAAHAEPSDLKRARRLFEEAGSLELQGKWSDAQERLRAALRIRETAHLRYALGWALENGERLLEARTEYDLSLQLARRDSISEVSQLAATRVAEVERKIPLVRIRVRGALAKDTRVLVDGREVSVNATGGTLQVDPGMRIIRIERSGQPPTELSISVAQGALRILDVPGDAPGAAAAPAGPSEPGGDVPASGRGPSPVPWILVGGGGTLAVGGALLFVSSSSDAAARDESTEKWCDATACVGGAAMRAETPEAVAFRREAYDAASRGNTKQIAGAIVGGLGVASIAVGTYLLFTSRDRADRPRAARASVELEATPLRGGAFAGASLRF